MTVVLNWWVPQHMSWNKFIQTGIGDNQNVIFINISLKDVQNFIFDNQMDRFSPFGPPDFITTASTTASDSKYIETSFRKKAGGEASAIEAILMSQEITTKQTTILLIDLTV